MLPKLETPVYETTLPISKQKVKFRPFLVKEQKILLLAMESGESQFVSNNVKQILQNCTIGDLDIEDLSSLDVEYYFIQLRARSVGEIVETKYKCQNKVGEEICNNLMPVNIELMDVSVDLNDYNETIKLNSNVGIKMKYPKIESIELLDGSGNIIEKTFDVIIDCIDYIFDNDNFYYPKEVSKKEIIDFIESLNIEQFKKIETYFKKLPKIKKEISVTCSKCGYKHSILIQGINNFLE